MNDVFEVNLPFTGELDCVEFRLLFLILLSLFPCRTFVGVRGGLKIAGSVTLSSPRLRNLRRSRLELVVLVLLSDIFCELSFGDTRSGR